MWQSISLCSALVPTQASSLPNFSIPLLFSNHAQAFTEPIIFIIILIMLISTSMDIVRPRLHFLFQVFHTSIQWTPPLKFFSFWCKVCLNLANNRASKHCRISRICSSDMCIYSQTQFLLCIFRLFVLLMRKSPRNQILCIVLHISLFIFIFFLK